MSTASQKLTEMIDDLVSAKTFNLDALDAIKALKTKAESLEEMVKSRDAQIETLKDTHKASMKTIEEQRAVISGVAAREQAVAERERAANEVDKACAVANARASAFEQAMKIVFAPNMVRESVQRMGGSYPTNGGPGSTTNDNGTTYRLDGYAQPGDPNTNGAPTL